MDLRNGVVLGHTEVRREALAVHGHAPLCRCET